jgi:hypothetical protein
MNTSLRLHRVLASANRCWIPLAVWAALPPVTLEAQDPSAMPPAVLRIDVENFVRYDHDTTDWSKLVTNPNIVSPPASPAATFATYTAVGDIVAINGNPAKGFRLLNPLNVLTNRIACQTHARYAYERATRVLSGD